MKIKEKKIKQESPEFHTQNKSQFTHLTLEDS